jgi:hypothetical protein
MRIEKIVRRALVLALVAGAAGAQSLYTFSPGGVVEFTGPPAGPCVYPNGPVIGAFPPIAVPCFAPGPPVAPFGDVAVDPTTDTIYVTDGPVIGVYTSAGAHLGSVPPIAPFAPLSGMGIDGGGGILWITDGFLYGGIALPFLLCGAPPPVAIGPFPVPIGPFFAGPIGDIDWDPGTGSLFACDAAGLVGNFFPGPASPPGPFGIFPVAPGPCPPLAPPLYGIAVDRTLPGTGTIYVTDGLTISYLVAPGVPAPLTFYTTAFCYPTPAPPPLSGLAFAGRQITYGAGANNLGGPVPTIGSVGQTWVGNPAYTMTLAGALPGAIAHLKYSPMPLCPPPIIVGLPLYLMPPLATAVIVPVGLAGTASFTAPIPPAFPIGLNVYLEWVVLMFPGVAVTSGAELTLIAP